VLPPSPLPLLLPSLPPPPTSSLSTPGECGAKGFVSQALIMVFFRLLGVRPSVFGRKLHRQPVRGANAREECHWSHACSLKCSLQASRRGNRWHPRVYISVR
jgi:hypothetical protein